MTLGDILKVYGDNEPFWVNYADETGFFDADYYESKARFENRFKGKGCDFELPYCESDEVEYITHDGDGVLTFELALNEPNITYYIVETDGETDYFIDALLDFDEAQRGARSVYESCIQRGFAGSDTTVELRAYDSDDNYELCDF